MPSSDCHQISPKIVKTYLDFELAENLVEKCGESPNQGVTYVFEISADVELLGDDLHPPTIRIQPAVAKSQVACCL